jgi:hypothetical protein
MPRGVKGDIDMTNITRGGLRGSSELTLSRSKRLRQKQTSSLIGDSYGHHQGKFRPIRRIDFVVDVSIYMYSHQ